MLENLTAIPVGNAAVASTVTAIEKQNFDRESISENSFKHVFNKDFSVNDELKANTQLGRSGGSQTALLNFDFKQLSEKLQAAIAQLEDGKTMPAGGNSLPVLPPEVGDLLHEIQQNLHAIKLEQSNDFSVEALPAELTNLLDQLAEIAGRLNAIFDQMNVDEAALIAEDMLQANKPDTVLSLPQSSDTATKDNHEQINFALSTRLRDSTLSDQNTQQQMLDEHTLQQLSTLSDFIQNIQALIPDRTANLGAEFVLEPKPPATENALLMSESATSSNSVQNLSAQGALLDSMIRRLEHVLGRIETVAAQHKNDAEGLSPMLAKAMSLNSQAGSAVIDAQRNSQALSVSSAAQNAASIEAFSPQLLALANAAQNPIQSLALPVNELAAQLNAQIQDTSFNLNAAANHNGTAQAGSAFVSQTAQPSATSAAQPFATQIGLPMNNTQWGDQFVQRVAWIAGQGITSAEIQLNPAELGPLHVRIDSHEDSARVVFTAHNASARDSIENNLPRLRDLFASQGLDLLDVDVESQQNKHGADADIGYEGNQQRTAEEGESAAEGLDLVATVNDASGNPMVASLVLDYGRVDAFA